MEWMQVQMQSWQKQVLARLKGPFDVVPQLAYSKTIAKSDKKTFAARHKKLGFCQWKRLFIEKGSSNRANKVLEVGLWVSYIFEILKRESVGHKNSI